MRQDVWKYDVSVRLLSVLYKPGASFYTSNVDHDLDYLFDLSFDSLLSGLVTKVKIILGNEEAFWSIESSNLVSSVKAEIEERLGGDDSILHFEFMVDLNSLEIILNDGVNAWQKGDFPLSNNMKPNFEDLNSVVSKIENLREKGVASNFVFEVSKSEFLAVYFMATKGWLRVVGFNDELEVKLELNESYFSVFAGCDRFKDDGFRALIKPEYSKLIVWSAEEAEYMGEKFSLIRNKFPNLLMEKVIEKYEEGISGKIEVLFSELKDVGGYSGIDVKVDNVNKLFKRKGCEFAVVSIKGDAVLVDLSKIEMRL